MAQRGDIDTKYEGIYGTIYEIVANAVRLSKLPPRETYGRLKLAIPAAWTTTNWSNTQPTRPSDEEHAKYAKAFLKEPCSWIDEGEARSGNRAAYFTSTDAFFAKTYLERLAGCDLVLDLGCGWGHRMWDLYLAGLDTQFVGGDRSDFSRQIMMSLSTLFPEAKMDWIAFDFLKPDFSGVKGSFKSVGVFTCHAIEQVTTLGPAMFDALLIRFPDAEMRGVHIEPITSQIDPSRAAERAYAISHKYNTDLYDVVRRHPALEITEAKSVIHDAHDKNPSALLCWTRKS